MVKGILASAGAMRPVLTAQGVLANNLANASTTGFRRDRVAFRLDAPAAGVAGQSPGSALAPHLATQIDPRPGSYQVTDRRLDMALQGDGYFVIATPDGERYTRGGHFVLAEDGTLVTPQGHAVMTDGGPLTLPSGAQLQVLPDGTLRDPERLFGKLQIVSFDEAPRFTHVGAGLLATETEPVAADEARVLQGVIEGPNVEPVQAMVEMITLLRHFEMNQKALQAQDESLGHLLTWVRA
jgi:flagellar basal body rod protein FlgG